MYVTIEKVSQMFNYPVPEPFKMTENINTVGRFYYKEGLGLPSVTTILKNTSRSTFLKHWNARNPGKLEAAGLRGTKMHTLIENYLRFKIIDSSCTSFKHFLSIKPLLDHLDVCFLELPVYSAQIGTAGRIDCAAVFNGIPVLVDWKSKDKPSKDLYDYPLQIAAYIHLLQDTYPDYPVKFNYGMIAVATPKKLDLYTFDPEDLEKHYDSFLKRRDEFYLKFCSLQA